MDSFLLRNVVKCRGTVATLQSEGCRFESGSVTKVVFFSFYNLMPKTLRYVSFYLPLILILTCFMFHTKLLYLFNIFCSPRLILVHLFWKSKTLSVYMQKMNKPFTISTHTQIKRRRRKKKVPFIGGIFLLDLLPLMCVVVD